MAARLQELCALLVQDFCGQLPSQIFSTLAENGRLSRAQLQHITRTPSRPLRHALAILVQQHLILHHTIDDGTTYYQVDWRNSYYLVRSNRIICLVEERYGEGAAKIVANLLQLGHARVGDLAQAFDLAATTKRDSGIEGCDDAVNGDAKVDGIDGAHLHRTRSTTISTVSQFHHTLRTLLRAGFLVKLGHRAYTPAADLQAEIEEIVISEQFPDGKVNGPKKQTEFKTAVNGLKRKWRDANEYSEHRDTESRGIIRRPAKRAKLNGGLTNGAAHCDRDEEAVDEENVPKLPNELVLRVNYAQSVLAFRSHRLEQLAETYLGGTTATVYGALLQVLEGKVRARDENLKVDESRDDEEEDLPTALTTDVAEILDPTIDLGLGIRGNGSTSGKLPNGKVKKKSKVLDPDFADIGIKMEAPSDSEDEATGFTSYQDRHKRYTLIEEHLKLLEEHPKSFCRRVGGGGRGEWKVSFPSLTDTLIHAEIDSTVLARFGRIAARIIRLLRDRGRLEEKQVAAFAMMRIKDVRAILTELQYAGIVEAQEVPKDAGRQPSRTVYLWFHDQHRVQNLLLQANYQGLSRMLQRLKQERENYKNAIEKAEMMDVKQAALAQNEREAIMQWREVEEKMLVQVQRMDETVALFRDFSGRDSSLVS